jgi:hypothetical protein
MDSVGNTDEEKTYRTLDLYILDPLSFEFGHVRLIDVSKVCEP